jgi:hypothetical protein
VPDYLLRLELAVAGLDVGGFVRWSRRASGMNVCMNDELTPAAG